MVTGFVQAFAKNIICQFSSLCQAVVSSENFEIDPSISGVLNEVVFINELLRGVLDLDAHMLRTLHGRF